MGRCMEAMAEWGEAVERDPDEGACREWMGSVKG